MECDEYRIRRLQETEQIAPTMDIFQALDAILAREGAGRIGSDPIIQVYAERICELAREQHTRMGVSTVTGMTNSSKIP